MKNICLNDGFLYDLIMILDSGLLFLGHPILASPLIRYGFARSGQPDMLSRFSAIL